MSQSGIIWAVGSLETLIWAGRGDPNRNNMGHPLIENFDDVPNWCNMGRQIIGNLDFGWEGRPE